MEVEYEFGSDMDVNFDTQSTVTSDLSEKDRIFEHLLEVCKDPEITTQKLDDAIQEVDDDDLNRANDNHQTAMSLLLGNNNVILDMVVLLYDAGADFNNYDSNSDAPITEALQNPNISYDIISFMLEADDSLVNVDSFFGPAINVYSGNPNITLSILDLLFEYGADPNSKSPFGTAFHVIAGNDNADLDCVKMLVDHGADGTFTNDKGETPLHLFAEREKNINNEMLEVVLRAGNTVNVPEHIHGVTPLYLFISSPELNIRMLDTLFLVKADPNIQNNYGDTTLHRACFLLDNDMIEIILRSGNADPNIQNNYENTPFHNVYLSEKLNIPIIRTMIDYGSNPCIKNGEGRVPVQLI